MKNKPALTMELAVTLLLCTGVGCGQHSSASTAPQAARSSSALASGTRRVEISDPQYQMTAYTMEVPTNWKFAGIVARNPGCHATGAALKYTMESADGQSAVILLPGVTWSWSSSPQMQKIMENQHCPGVEIASAASFLVNIAVPNIRPNAKIVAVLPLKPEGQKTLADQLAQAQQANAAMAQRYGQKPQKLTNDGARVRISYVRDGHPVEEMIVSVMDCTETETIAMYAMPASTRRSCTTRGETILRAPQGGLDAMLDSPLIAGLGKAIQPNQEWQARLQHDQQAAFQQFQAANNAQFQQMMKNSQAQHEQLMANGRAFNAQLQASTDRAMAADRAHQAAMDESAHKMALYALDRQEFTDPNTGHTIEASNQYNHQWISSDGSTLIQTNDHTYDPNGQVYPVSQSWTELVPKQ